MNIGDIVKEMKEILKEAETKASEEKKGVPTINIQSNTHLMQFEGKSGKVHTLVELNDDKKNSIYFTFHNMDDAISFIEVVKYGVKEIHFDCEA